MLPPFLREVKLIGYLQSLLAPIDTLYYKWRLFRDENLYKVHHNGQICYLRKALNDRLDSSQRRIYIGNANKYERQYLYTTPENRPRYLGTLFLNRDYDYADTGVDFIVYAPKEVIKSSLFELHALTDLYKMAGKRYKIETI